MAKVCQELNVARATGAKTYFNGKPCKHGHIAQRNTKCSTCVVCLAMIYAKSQKKRSVSLKAWREKNKESINSSKREWKKAHREIVSASGIRYAKKNAEKLRQKRRSYYLKNKVMLAEKRNKWLKENPDKNCASQAMRRAAKLMATPKWADASKIKQIYTLARDEARHTGKPVDVDHIVPLKHRLVCGLHCEFNLRPLDSLENKSKQNRVWPGMPGEAG